MPAVRPETYVIGIGDVLEVNVWKEGELSKTVPVRPDGMITMPLIGEIKAVGLTPVQLQDQVTTTLEKVVSEPQVTVMVVSVNSMSFNIMGNVNKPGYYPLVHPITHSGRDCVEWWLPRFCQGEKGLCFAHGAQR